jgi:CrcB protein
MAKYFWIALGGALGAISRYVLGVWVYKRLGTAFPYGTFVINMSGCFLIGLIVTILDLRTGMSNAWRLAIPIGFIGAYTTFSTFEYETLRAAQGGQPGIAFLNVALSVVVGYLAVWLGVLAGKLVA